MCFYELVFYSSSEVFNCGLYCVSIAALLIIELFYCNDCSRLSLD